MDITYNDDKLCGFSNERERAVGIKYTVVEDLVEEPVDLAFFKAHARLDFDFDDSLCTSYIKAARQHLERYSQLSFGEKTIRLTAIRLPRNFELMYGNVKEAAGYETLGNILLNGQGRNKTIDFTTEWNPLPEDVKIAICRYAAGLYMNREDIITDEEGRSQREVRNEAEKMLRPYMIKSLI